MAHERTSEPNRLQQDGVVPETPYGVPTDDLYPDGEPHPQTTEPGAPERGTKLNPNVSVDWGKEPGEDMSRELNRQKDPVKSEVCGGIPR